MRAVLGWFAAFVVAMAYVGYQSHAVPAAFMTDFRAFYCAGAAVRSWADPYRVGGIRTCERDAQFGPPADARTLVVVPAPLPGYAIAPFVPLSAMPFAVAAWLWAALLCVATLATVEMVRRLTSLPLPAVAAAIVPVGIGWSAVLGEVFPLAGAALVAAALLLRRGRNAAAAAAASCAMIEPHVGIAACIALLVAVPRTRPALAAAAAVAAGLSLLATGAAGIVEYLRDVVPAHALANATNDRQLSLTSVLSFFGMDSRTAVHDGDVMLAIMAVAGIACARRLAARTGDGAYLLLVPPAFAMFGGVHVHVTQVVAAIPAFLLLAAREPRLRPALTVAVALVMLPWHFIALPALLPFAPVAVAVFARPMASRRLALLAPLGALAVLAVAVVLALRGMGPNVAPFFAHQYSADALAQAPWSDFVRRVLSTHDAMTLWLRLPSWCGMLLGIALLARAAVPDVLRLPSPGRSAAPAQ